MMTPKSGSMARREGISPSFARLVSRFLSWISKARSLLMDRRLAHISALPSSLLRLSDEEVASRYAAPSTDTTSLPVRENTS